jgi:hypothetical protein
MQVKDLKTLVKNQVRLSFLITGSTGAWFVTFWQIDTSIDYETPRFELETARGNWKKYKTVDSVLNDLRSVGIDISNPRFCSLTLNPTV